MSRDGEGGPGEVERLIERHLPTLHAFVRLRAGAGLLRYESSSDLAQSVCRELLDHRARYRHRGDSEFRRWLYTTASRKIANRYAYYHAQKRDVAKAAPERPAPRASDASDAGLLAACRTLSTPSRKLIASEEIARIEAALERLPEERREIILLSRMGGLTHREIAEHMGRTELACRLLLHRALAELAEHLEEAEGASR